VRISTQKNPEAKIHRSLVKYQKNGSANIIKKNLKIFIFTTHFSSGFVPGWLWGYFASEWRISSRYQTQNLNVR